MIKEIDQSNQKVDNTTGQGIVGKPKKKEAFHYLRLVLSKILPLPYQTQQNISIIITNMMMLIISLIRNMFQDKFITATITIALAIAIAITITIIKLSN